jgi:hypothetical protein
MGGEPDRTTLREQRFERVRNAATAFYAAASDHARVVAEFGDMMDNADGTAAVLQSARRERDAIEDDNRAWKALSDFLALD